MTSKYWDYRTSLISVKITLFLSTKRETSLQLVPQMLYFPSMKKYTHTYIIYIQYIHFYISHLQYRGVTDVLHGFRWPVWLSCGWKQLHQPKVSFCCRTRMYRDPPDPKNLTANSLLPKFSLIRQQQECVIDSFLTFLLSCKSSCFGIWISLSGAVTPSAWDVVIPKRIIASASQEVSQSLKVLQTI